MFQFDRGIDHRFVDRLNAEYERGGWWRAVASDPDLFIAIRGGYLNVYWNGNSLLKLSLDGDRLLGQVHYKYLLRPDVPSPYVPVDDGAVRLGDASSLFQADLSDLAALKKAAALYAGDEKAGVHRIIQSNSNVLDAEVAFGLEDRTTRRLDFAALRSSVDGAEVVFFESKQFSNPELRAAENIPAPVVEQIAGYKELIAKHDAALRQSYRAVCSNLAALLGVRDRYAASLDLMQRIASGEKVLRINPAVWLVVFGYDSDQWGGPIWKPHKDKLDKHLPGHVLYKGSPKGFTRGISSAVA